MLSQIYNLAKKPVQLPANRLPDSLMQMLNKTPSIQSINEDWVNYHLLNKKRESITLMTQKRKNLVNPILEAQKVEIKALKESTKFKKERATSERAQQEAILAGASESGAPAHTEGTTPISKVSDLSTTLLSYEQTPIHKG